MQVKKKKAAKAANVKPTKRPGCKNPHTKGSAGEREAAKFLTALGFKAERACQLGVKDGRDVICEDLPNVFLEVKRDESVKPGTAALERAMQQAESKAAVYRPDGGANPAVLFRRNGQPWALAVRLDLSTNPMKHSGTIAILYGPLDILDALTALNTTRAPKGVQDFGRAFGCLVPYDAQNPDGSGLRAIKEPDAPTPQPAAKIEAFHAGAGVPNADNRPDGNTDPSKIN